MRLLCVLLCAASALDNGIRLPPMGWSSWYGFTSHIDEVMLREMADAMVSSGLHEAGYEHIWIDDGWAIGRENKSGSCSDSGPTTGADSCKVIVDPVLFPNGMRNLSDYVHSKGLKFGIYTSKGPRTCLGYSKGQPPRPGSYGYEQIDADTYAHDWQVDQVKDDGCGQTPGHNPWIAMRDALNKTGRRIVYAVHAGNCNDWSNQQCVNGSIANMWRTGGDLCCKSFDMWTNRLDLATTPLQRALAGPGSFPNPDFLEVAKKGDGMSPIETRAMFTMWAALPAPLILSAGLRESDNCLTSEVLETIANREVIAINQDPLAQPMQPVSRSADGLEVWQKPLSGGRVAVIFFHRNATGCGPCTVHSHGCCPPLQPPSNGTDPSGKLVALGSCASALAVDLPAAGGASSAITVRGTFQGGQLCLGKLGGFECDKSAVGRVGVVPCNSSDPTQHWTGVDPATGQINSLSSATHRALDLNAAGPCQGTASTLIYPAQGHANEQYRYDATAGRVSQRSNPSSCLVAEALSPPPRPLPPSRTISVTWEQLGWSQSKKVAVRDLWAGKALGEKDAGFSRPVAFHEAAIFVLTPESG